MKKYTLAFLMAGSILLSSCDVLLNTASQATEILNLVNCDFSLKSVDNVTVAGINVKNLAQGQLSATDIVKLAAAYQSKRVPIAMNLNVGVSNPTTTQATMTSMDWILSIDGKDMANGLSTNSYTIKPNASTTVPLGVTADLGDLFSQQGLEALKNFATSFTTEGVSSKVGLRIKPSLTVGTMTIPFQNYITLEKKTGR